MTDVVNYHGKPGATGEELVDGIGDGLLVLAAGPLEAPFARGLYEWMNMLVNHRGAGKAFKSVARQYLPPPNWMRDIEKITNPDRSDTYDNNILNEIANNIEASIPFISADLPPRLTVFGEKATEASSPFSIMPETVSKYDDIFMALNANDVFIQEPRQMVNVEGTRVDMLEMEDKAREDRGVDGYGWKFHQYKQLLGEQRRKFLSATIRSAGFHKATRGPRGSERRGRASQQSMLRSALASAKWKTHEMFSKRNPGTAFSRAYKGIQEESKPVRANPLHAGERARIEENKISFKSGGRS